MEQIIQEKRNSYIEIGEIYFWTATINKWQRLLSEDGFKQVIIDSLSYLSSKNKIDVFAFVIMPNHIHLIWRIKSMNGKETSQGSFLKFTAHTFKRLLFQSSPGELQNYRVKASNKEYEFWQRDPLAIPLYTKEVAIQKLDYIHNNPLAKDWNLAKEPADYMYSSAKFYERNEKEFEFIQDIFLEF